MKEEDIRYYEKRLAEERARAETERDEHLRSVHAQFAETIERKIRGMRKSAELDAARPDSSWDLPAASGERQAGPAFQAPVARPLPRRI